MSSSFKNIPDFEYQPIEGVERLERYRPGGYHPILIGDVLKDRYRIVHKLGHGTYSTIWLSRDEQREVYVAIKISTDDSPRCEADILRTIANSSVVDDLGRAMMPKIQDQFKIEGPNGSHDCFVTSPAQSSVATARFSRVFKIETARALVAQLISAIAYIHSCGFVHGDIHLGNALIRLPTSFDQLSVKQLYEKFGEPCTESVVRTDGKPLSFGVPSQGISPVRIGKKANEISLSEAHLIVSDFGEAFCPFDPQQKRLGDECRAPLPVLPPETHFDSEKSLSFPADIWTLACAIWSILGPRPLFDGTLATRDDICSQQIDILGSLPSEWWEKWEIRHEYFEETGQSKNDRFVVPSLDNCFEQEIQALRRRDGMEDFDREETTALLAMLRPMLAFRPEERDTAATVLRSDWMANWGLAELEKVPRV